MINGGLILACVVGVFARCQSCRITEYDGVLFAVGNIPYDATEEQLRAICEQVGPVVSFRYAVLDRLGVAGLESGCLVSEDHVVHYDFDNCNNRRNNIDHIFGLCLHMSGCVFVPLLQASP